MAKDACDYTKWVVIILLVLLAVVIVGQCMKKKTEAYAPIPMTPSAVTPATMETAMAQTTQYRPFTANLPAPLEPRSYPGLTSNSLFGDAGAGAMSAVPPQPVMITQSPQMDFGVMGGGYGGAETKPFGALTSNQVGNVLGATINGGTPDYVETALPLGDIHNVSMDPTQPENFMYTRTVFAPLKRQYGNGVDYYRGDIPITQEYRGWFDVRPATQKDVVTGYFDRYIDIQQETAIKDAQWTRSTPVQTLYDSSISTAGDQFRLSYVNV